MDKKIFCRCGMCNHLTQLKNINDSYIICEECHRILSVENKYLIVDGVKISTELETKLLNSLNMEHDVKEITKDLKRILLEGDMTNEIV